MAGEEEMIHKQYKIGLLEGISRWWRLFLTGIRFLCLFVDTSDPFTLPACVIWLEGLVEVSEEGVGVEVGVGDCFCCRSSREIRARVASGAIRSRARDEPLIKLSSQVD